MDAEINLLIITQKCKIKKQKIIFFLQLDQIIMSSIHKKQCIIISNSKQIIHKAKLSVGYNLFYLQICRLEIATKKLNIFYVKFRCIFCTLNIFFQLKKLNNSFLMKDFKIQKSISFNINYFKFSDTRF